MMCLGVFIVVQALGRTQLSAHSPEINSENLLVLLMPLVVDFRRRFFLTLLNQMNMPSPQSAIGHRRLGGRCVACRSLSTLLPPENFARSLIPPYYPPEIQQDRRLDETG